MRRPDCTRSKCAPASSDRWSIIRGAAATTVGVFLALRVEHPQRVDRERLAGLRAQLAAVVVEESTQRVEVRGPRRGIAERVEQQAVPAQPERAEEAVEQRDDLDVEVRVHRAERLDADLVVLPVPTGLRRLGPEVRRDVPDLPRCRRPVLDERTHDRAGALGAQREPPSAAVFELVHLLLHDVGRLADTGEHLVVLEHRRDVQAVAGALDVLREQRDERGPPSRLRREDVVGALGRTEEVGFGDGIGR